MSELRWPVVVITALMALALFFGFKYYQQRYLQEEPFLAALREMEAIENVELLKGKDVNILQVTPAPDYSGSLRELLAAVEEKVEGRIKGSLTVKFLDRRNSRLEEFAERITPALYEGTRLGNYREVAAAVEVAGQGLQDVRFTVDHRHLYVQARDGAYYLLLMVPLEEEEGGSS